MNLILLGGSEDRIFSYAWDEVSREETGISIDHATHLEVLDRLDGELHLDLLCVPRGLWVEWFSHGGGVGRRCKV